MAHRPSGTWTRGRGGRTTSGYTPSFHRAPPPSHRSINDDLIMDNVVETLEIPDIHGAAPAATEVRNMECIGSYDWLESRIPTIIVPSSPPEWMGEPKLPLTLDPDTRVQVLNHNQYRLPSAALLPLITASDTMGKKVDWPSVDFVTDRNTLGKLMWWANGTTKEDGSWHNFRIDTELVGGRTVLFHRWEAHDREASTGNSYGLNFEQATTAPAKGCERASTGHHRIIKYDFCDLKLVVRYQVDACLPTASTSNCSATKETSVGVDTKTPDDLADDLADMKLKGEASVDAKAPPSDQRKPAPNSPSSPLRIIRAGSEVPQDAIIELTTRSIHYVHAMKWHEIIPRLHLTQTPHFYIGVHRRGTFSQIQKRNLEDVDLVAQRRATEPGLQKLGSALQAIQKIVVEYGRKRRLSLVCSEGQLRVYERTSERTSLPEDVKKRFDSALDPESEI